MPDTSGLRTQMSAQQKAQPPSKKIKTLHNFKPTGPILQIILESDPSASTYNVHEELLRKNSSYLDEYLENQADRKPVLLKDVEDEVFASFSAWLYTKTLEIDELEEAEDVETLEEEYPAPVLPES